MVVPYNIDTTNLSSHFSLKAITFFRLVHAAVVQKQMGSVVVLNPVDRMVRDNVFLAGQKRTQIGGHGLAVVGYFRVIAIAAYVIHQIVSYIGTASVREAGGMRKRVFWIHKSLLGCSSVAVRFDIFLHFVEIFCFDIVAAEF